MHKLTILRTTKPQHLATKKHIYSNGEHIKSIPYSRPYLFDAKEVEYNGICGLYDLLKELEQKERQFIIRGSIAGDKPWLRKTPRFFKKKKDCDDPPFSQDDKELIMFDIDNIIKPSWIFTDELNPDTQELKWAAAWVHEQLPQPFADANCIFQYSASAFLPGKNEIKLHLWFILDKKVCCPSIRAYTKNMKMFDDAIYNPVQPLYTAAPIFKGIEDPLKGGRLGTLRGKKGFTEVRTPPELESLEEYKEGIKMKYSAVKKGLFKGDVPYRFRKYSNAVLKNSCEKIRKCSTGSRNITYFKVAAALGNIIATGVLCRESVIQQLHRANDNGQDALEYHEADRVFKNGISQGELEPFDFNKLTQDKK